MDMKNTMRIAICDDSPESRESIDAAVRQYKPWQKINFDTDIFESGSDFLAKVRAGAMYDFIFMDIRMPDMTGIDVCHELPKSYFDTPIVFVTAYSESWPQITDFNNAGFLIKNFSQQTFDNTVNVVRNKKKNEWQYVYYNNGSKLAINCNRIRYFYVKGHDVRMDTVGGEIFLHDVTLADIEKDVAGHGFIKTHRSYIINMRYYFKKGNSHVQITVENGTRNIPLARGRIKIVEDAVIEFMTRGEDAF